MACCHRLSQVDVAYLEHVRAIFKDASLRVNGDVWPRDQVNPHNFGKSRGYPTSPCTDKADVRVQTVTVSSQACSKHTSFFVVSILSLAIRPAYRRVIGWPCQEDGGVEDCGASRVEKPTSTGPRHWIPIVSCLGGSTGQSLEA